MPRSSIFLQPTPPPLIGRYLLLLCLITLVINPGRVSATGSCAESKLCCPGRDSACVVQKTSPSNAIVQQHNQQSYHQQQQLLGDKPCYCDHACLKLGDCCGDFKEACGVLDCVVSAWGPWSDCDSECGPGAQTRTRLVERGPENGGKHCPQLAQRRGCQGVKCHRRNPKSALKEVALLLPAELSDVRHANDSNDIRTNLRYRYVEDPEHDLTREYCVTFTVTKASKACYKEPSLSQFIEGARVCVHCQTQALRRELDWRCEGDGGTEAMITRWSMLSFPHCHGKWLRTRKTGPECSSAELCQPRPHYIFV
ncbi:somatomedin-B and thrombospondin type-1 domain-containing protein-like [Trichogramma pretiosum]|uniref:somatomedin-B and thrombospondin type-1 domain-containing protein-like n=1 Tax=Trichogramma pretiosum TaxID=7493 RepID=UPI0006C942BA|nr:somatomedin-B and thrombospondin type-1 domain-containing protein-like [Trichogramma pretiosum]